MKLLRDKTTKIRDCRSVTLLRGVTLCEDAASQVDFDGVGIELVS